jgi:hypothetical protein
MPSFQNAAPGGKSMKFTDALNPFTPFLAQPVSGDVGPVLWEPCKYKQSINPNPFIFSIPTVAIDQFIIFY